MSNIKIYDCPQWVSYPNKRGKLVTEVSDSSILSCESIFIKGEIHAFYKKIYNIDEECYEVWVKGEVKQ